MSRWHLSLRVCPSGRSFYCAHNQIILCLGITDERIVRKNVRLAMYVNLEKLSELLAHKKCWAFSLVFDGATVQSRSFLDVRIRICIDGVIHKFHLLAIPLRSKHTGQAMFDFLKLAFDNLIHAQIWQGKLVGTPSDGAANMTGRVSGAFSRLSALTLTGYVRVWGMAHQLDPVLQKPLARMVMDCVTRN